MPVSERTPEALRRRGPFWFAAPGPVLVCGAGVRSSLRTAPPARRVICRPGGLFAGQAGYLPDWLFVRNEFEKFVPRAFRVEECSGKGGSGGDCVGFLHAAHGHAGMQRLYDDGHAERMKGFLYAVAYLDRQPLLHLQPSGEGLHDAGYFAESRDFAVGDICYVGFPYERQHVVLAHRKQFDVLHYYHLPVLFLENCRQYRLPAVLPVALREELEGFRHPCGRFLKPFASGVFSEEPQYGFYVGSDFFRRFLVVFFYLFICHDVRTMCFRRGADKFACKIR